MNKKNSRILLFILSGVFALIAAVVFLGLWDEGETAKLNAQELLAKSNIPFVQSGNIINQTDEPEALAEAAASTLPETKLNGYRVVARLDIEKLDLSLPVLSETSLKALKISVCFYSGSQPGWQGNYVIAGHNYRNGAHFGRLDELSEGDRVTVTDIKGNRYAYAVYKTELIRPDESEALEETAYESELTLMTCEQNGNRRLLVRCKIQDP